jgi:spore coat protein H
MVKTNNTHKFNNTQTKADILTISRPGSQSRTVKLAKQQLFIGRSSQNDIVLSAPGVSRWHICVENTVDGWHYIDLTNNGTGFHRRERPVVDNIAKKWHPGQLLRVGPYLLEWHNAYDDRSKLTEPLLTASTSKTTSRRKAIFPTTGLMLVFLLTAIFALFYQDEHVKALISQSPTDENPAVQDEISYQQAQLYISPDSNHREFEQASELVDSHPVNEMTQPVIFSTDFNQSVLDNATWAYHLYKGVAMVRDSQNHGGMGSNLNWVLQLGHAVEWSAVTLEKGTNWRNYEIELDVKLLNTVNDADNFFLGVRHDRDIGEYTVSLDLAGQRARLSSTIHGFWEGVHNEVPLAVNANTWYRLNARIDGNLINFYMDGNHIGTIDDDQLKAGTIRLMTPPGSYVHIDNLTVKEIPSSPEPGDLIITEIMFHDEEFQWFEMINISDRYLQIDSLEITNGRDVHKIAYGSFVLTPSKYMLMVSQKPPTDFMTDVRQYIFGNALRFSADNGYLGLLQDGRIITEIEYSEDTGWLLQESVSLALHPDYYTSRRQNNGFHWCPSVGRASDSPPLRATPGKPNHVCIRELPIHNYGNRQSGELIITEIMIDLPGSDQGREWFEVYNPSGQAFSLRGITIATDSPAEKHIFTEDIYISPRSYAVFAQSGLLINDLPEDIPVYQYPGRLSLRNNSGELVILDGNRVIDSITWRDNGWWPVRAGISMSLHPDALSAYSNDDALNWCLAWTLISESSGQLGTPGRPNDPCPMWEINSPLQDSSRAYESTSLAPVTISITIDQVHLENMKANPFSNIEYPARFEADGYTAGKDNNATMRPRGGNFTRVAAIQSYTIRLEEPFQNQSTIALNKHDGDPSRLRNALSFQLFQDMEDMIGLRTQFVHLHINGEDFGLYTMVETRNSRMLRNHRLDDRGHLFNIEYGFFLYKAYDRERRINSILDKAELRAGNSHDGLLKMMDAIYSGEDTHQIIDRHFNRDNLLTYFASVYLMRNLDSRAKNYLLYSTPREPERFYFIPWDWDLAFFPRTNGTFFVGSWREGFGNWVGIGIFDRMLHEPELVDALLFKMVELAQTSLSQERVNTLVDQLAAEVDPFTRRYPDLNVISPSRLRDEAEAIMGVISESARQIVDLIERPLPVSVISASYDADNQAVTFFWDSSVSLQNRPLVYEIVLFEHSQWDEDNIVWRSQRTTDTSLTIQEEDLPDDVNAGPYFWMVYVWDAHGNYNTSYNMDEFGNITDVVNLP